MKDHDLMERFILCVLHVLLVLLDSIVEDNGVEADIGTKTITRPAAHRLDDVETDTHLC
jgi:hypothetical protein